MERDRDVEATDSQTFQRHVQTTYAWVLGIPDVVRTTNASIAVLSVSDVRPKQNTPRNETIFYCVAGARCARFV